jgi:hypothetical protein
MKEEIGEMDASGIREDMEVRGADGSLVGIVDGVEGERIKLTRKDSADGEHHYVELSGVERVDEHVHLADGASAT